MPLKSIFSIEIKDEQWQRFLDEFKKYKADVRDMPGEWGKFGEAVEKLTSTMSDLGENISGVADHLKKTADEGDRFHQQSEKSAGFWASMAGSTGRILQNITGVTRSLFAWTGIASFVGGALGIGGLFGLERLAYGAGAARSSAQGLGVTIGQQRAFNVNYSPLLSSPEGLLSATSQAQLDYSKRWAFSALGINNVEGRDPAELAAEVARRGRELTASNTSSQYADALGLTSVFGLSAADLRRLRAGNLEKAESGYRRDVGYLNTSDDAARRWQDFSVKMDEASARIRSALEGGLSKLAPGLEKLTGSLEHLIDVAANSPTIAHWIDELAEALDKFASWLSGKSGSSAGKAAAPTQQPEQSFLQDWRDKIFGGGLFKGHNPGNLRSWSGVPTVNGFAQFFSDQQGLDALSKQLLLYQDRDKLDTIRGIITKYAPPSDNNDTEAYIKSVSRRMGVGAEEHIDLHDKTKMSEMMYAIIRQEGTLKKGADVTIRIENQTGNNVVVNAKQAAVAAP